ncbi:MAG: YigZ family protein [Firmicutes bacterium]|nr:YigZ family protein [Bacillota bacterium]
MSTAFTVLKGTWSLFTIRHSRFISCAFQLSASEELGGILQSAQNSWPQASHYVWAYILGSGQERMSDDGEPQGTAGAPTVTLIRKHLLVYTAIVTVRYFGGTKLGHGGLLRAYQQAASHALSHAQLGRYHHVVKATVTMPYDSWGRAQNFLIKENIAFDPTFLHHVEFRCEVQEDNWEGFWSMFKASIAPKAQLVESELVTAIAPWNP